MINITVRLQQKDTLWLLLWPTLQSNQGISVKQCTELSIYYLLLFVSICFQMSNLLYRGLVFIWYSIFIMMMGNRCHFFTTLFINKLVSEVQPGIAQQPNILTSGIKPRRCNSQSLISHKSTHGLGVGFCLRVSSESKG